MVVVHVRLGALLARAVERLGHRQLGRVHQERHPPSRAVGDRLGVARGSRSSIEAKPEMGYVELHCHSAYSFLDGASLPEELAARAAELGYEALALTDHDGVYGSLEFAHAAKALGVTADHRRRGDARKQAALPT